MKHTIIKNARIVNEGQTIEGDLQITNDKISKIGGVIDTANAHEIDAKGQLLLPGVVDDQVHFREPGLTHKACIATEAKAAVAGGTTSFMEMPNTKPPIFTQDALQGKYDIASQCSLANYSFFMGASNDNIEELLKTDPKTVCGLKVFMGSSTGNLLVDSEETLSNIFSNAHLLVATHCEDEDTVKSNEAIYKSKFGEEVDFKYHPIIRDEKACLLSSEKAIRLAKKYNTRLHILHISTMEELDLFTNKIPLEDKRITAEVCVHHLWFSADDYAQHGSLIKCNPAIKAPHHKEAILKALLDDRLDIIATDHAPHTWDEKQNTYFNAPSGVPLVQHSLQMMLQFVQEGKLTIEKVVEKMAHAPAICFQLAERGFIREGYKADLVLVDDKAAHTVEKSNFYYKCNWSPFEGHTFNSTIRGTFVNGNLVYNNLDGQAKFMEGVFGERLYFDR